ncbi:MAG: hypothetical protein PHY27_13200 [Parabacteroides sp.]|nr:hypothetical protein [Parabacteroides sp.]
MSINKPYCKGENSMDNISREYTLLFNGISSVITELQAITFRLAGLQQAAEQLYIEQADESKPEATGAAE